MQFAATVHEAARRIEEAGAVFRFKARQTTEEFENLGAHWSDSRSKHFNQHFLQPQREAMEEGERLSRRYLEFSTSAVSKAQQAEDELSAFFAVAEECESMMVELVRTAGIAGQLRQQVIGKNQSLVAETRALDSTIAAIAEDPGG